MQRSFEISFYTNTASEIEEVKRSGVCSSFEKEEYTLFFFKRNSGHYLLLIYLFALQVQIQTFLA